MSSRTKAVPEGQYTHQIRLRKLKRGLTLYFAIGFVESADRQKVRCVACSAVEPNSDRHWILRASLKRHQGREEHKRCARIFAQKETTRHEAERELQALEQEFLCLDHPERLDLMPANIPESAQRGGPVSVVTEEEKRMWEDFEHEGADFKLSAGADPQLHIDQARARFSNLCDNLVFLDDEEVARVMGVVEGNVEDTAIDAATQEEQALLDLLDDYGESTLALISVSAN